jgi:hypothetical protein
MTVQKKNTGLTLKTLQPARATSAPAPGPAPVLQPAKPQSAQPELAPLRMPSTVRMTTSAVAPSAAPQREAAAVMLKRLEPLIQAQVEEILAVLERERMKPEDVQAAIAFNIVGRQDQVCTYCKRHGCGFRPVMYAKQNTEIELLEDDFLVATQAMARAGVSYAAVVYDEDVLVLREMAPPSAAQDTTADVELEMQRFRAFKNRKTYPDPTSSTWLATMLAKWRPEHASAPVVGKADDLGAIGAARKIFEQTPGRGGPKFFMLATSVAPSTGLLGQEFGLKKAGILANALAVGKDAERIRDDLFTDTAVVHDAHQAREMIGNRIASLIELAKEQEVD